MSRAALLLLAALGLTLVPSSSRAQSAPGKRPGLLGEIRNRLSFRPPRELWEEARGKSHPEAARPLMENLCDHSDDPEIAARAALWLGHLQYGAGQTQEALDYFTRALSRAPEGSEREEAAFWVAQCQNLLGLPATEAGRREAAGLDDVLAEMVRYDGELRVGQFDQALRGYLGLEGEARRAGCLSPLFYRVGLVASAAWERGRDFSVDWGLIRRWEPSVAASPERGLVAEMAASRPETEGQPATAPSDEGTGAAPATPNEQENSPPAANEQENGPTPATGEPENGTAPASDTGGRQVAPGEPQASDGWYSVQLGAFQSRESAMAEISRLTSLGLPVRLDQEDAGGARWWKIRLGKVRGRAEADDLARRYCREVTWQIVRIAP